ncbi:MAG: TonB-dependent receptor, partial [Gemmatimonadetes bacterium]|nr:TonB-dependent receptor [Gemmatimonadota bacterium]
MNPRLRRIGVIASLAICGSLAPTAARAQAEYEVRGTIADSAGAGLGGAMVVALTLPDSALTEFTTTNGDGAFVLRGLTAGPYVLQVTLLGYGTVRNELEVASADVDAGTIRLAVMAVEMDPLVVTLEHVPFLNQRDTLSYNALAFETRPNATVEDLLRRLPGIEVEADGSIKAQGEDVENVLVDGREFFGRDPTIATRSLPADAVESVEVYDKESDTAEFTGIPDGEEERTINLRLREEARSGIFGRGGGGLGAEMGEQTPLSGLGDILSSGDSQVPYDGSLTLNRFTSTTQIALVGGANSVNKPGFGGEYAQFGGGRFRSGGEGGSQGEDGITESAAVGLNLNHDFGEDTWLRSSYFFSSADNLQNQTRDRQQLLGSEVASLLDQTSSARSDDVAHRINLNSQVRFTEGHDLRLRANLNRRSTSSASTELQETRSVDGALLNQAASDYSTDFEDFSGDARLTWRKRLADNGRSLVLEARANWSDPEETADLSSTISGDSQNPNALDQTVLQDQSTTGHTFGHLVRLSWTEPLAERTTLELFGRWSGNDQDEDKSIFDLNDGTPVFNDALSSAFERTYTYLRGGLRFNTNNEDTRLVLGLQVQSSELDGTVLDLDQRITSGFTHVLPSANLRLRLGESRNLNVRYVTSTREPSMTELQPFTDNSDPLEIYVGNPSLTPEYNHRLNADYRFFDQFSFLNLFAYTNLNFTTNNISQSRTVDED